MIVQLKYFLAVLKIEICLTALRLVRTFISLIRSLFLFLILLQSFSVLWRLITENTRLAFLIDSLNSNHLLRQNHIAPRIGVGSLKIIVVVEVNAGGMLLLIIFVFFRITIFLVLLALIMYVLLEQL